MLTQYTSIVKLSKQGVFFTGYGETETTYICLLQCTENPIYVFPEMKLQGLVSNSYIHVSVSNFIYSQDLSAYLAAAE